MQYKLVSSNNPTTFNDLINLALEAGWKFSGELEIDKCSGLYKGANGFSMVEYQTTFSREMTKDE